VKIVMMSPKALKPHPENPRRNKAAILPVRKSLDEFGFRQPIVVWKGNVIIVGHSRWEASLLPVAYEQVPVHIADDLTEAQARAYRLADNKLAELAEWDEDLFMQEVQAIMAEGEVDLRDFGFTDADLGLLQEDIEKDKKADQRWLENYEVLPEAKPKWILIRAQEDVAAELVADLRSREMEGVIIHYSGESPPAKEGD
jgi:hypothetical protein